MIELGQLPEDPKPALQKALEEVAADPDNPRCGQQGAQLVGQGQPNPDEEGRLYLQRGCAHARLGDSAPARNDFRAAISKTQPLSEVSLAAGRNLRRIEQRSWEGKPVPGWLPHVILFSAAWLVLFASIFPI